MPLQKFEQLIDQLKGLKSVVLSGLGESFVNKSFLEMIAYLKSRNIRVIFSSNFTIVNRSIARRLVELSVDEIQVSIDGATKDVYEKIRVGADFHRVIANVRGFMDARHRLRSPIPKVTINFVTTTKNLNQVRAMVELSESLHVDELVISDMRPFEESRPLLATAEDVSSSLRKSLRHSDNLGVNVVVQRSLRRPINKCNLPWSTAYITYDGYVMPCCYSIQQTGNRARQMKLSLGNVFTQDFLRIWNSEAYNALRREVKAGRSPETCRGCPLYAPKETITFARERQTLAEQKHSAFGDGPPSSEAVLPVEWSLTNWPRPAVAQMHIPMKSVSSK